jgi:hypothetical protein
MKLGEEKNRRVAQGQLNSNPRQVERSLWLQVDENGANCGHCLRYKRRENWLTVLLEESQKGKRGKKWKMERGEEKIKERKKGKNIY